MLTMSGHEQPTITRHTSVSGRVHGFYSIRKHAHLTSRRRELPICR
jgi:hypothetical protein